MTKTKKEAVRFLIVTACVGGTDFGLYYLLIRSVPTMISKTISFVFANVVGYIFHKYWTFKKKEPSYPEAWRNLIIDLLLLVTNVGINQAILHFWPQAVFLALAAASLSAMLLSFGCKKWWVFKSI